MAEIVEMAKGTVEIIRVRIILPIKGTIKTIETIETSRIGIIGVIIKNANIVIKKVLNGMKRKINPNLYSLRNQRQLTWTRKMLFTTRKRIFLPILLTIRKNKIESSKKKWKFWKELN